MKFTNVNASTDMKFMYVNAVTIMMTVIMQM